MRAQPRGGAWRENEGVVACTINGVWRCAQRAWRNQQHAAAYGAA